MKKVSIIALVVAAAMFCAVPAMAVTMDFSGSFRARGYYLNNPTLNDQTPRTDSFMDMRLKMKPVLQIHDQLSITSEVLMVNNEHFGDTHSELTEWERAYMTANFDMFDLHVGRMAGGICGLTYCDAEGDADRVKIGLKGMDPLGITLVYQKTLESDADYHSGTTPNDADDDNDVYIGLFSFKPEGIDSGILIAYYDYASSTDLGTGVNYNQQIWNLNPWFRGTFGPVTAMAEVEWRFGDQYDYSDGGTADVDRDSWRWLVDVGVDMEAFSAGAGWAHADGEDAGTDYTDANLGGDDWEPLLILTNDTAGKFLGGAGNLNPANNNALGTGTMSDLGFDIIYGYGSVTPMENVTISAIFAWATADETQAVGTSVDDDLGWEADVSCKIQLMDNLTYDATVGFFDPGDLWKLGSSTDNLDEVWAVMHTIQVTF